MPKLVLFLRCQSVALWLPGVLRSRGKGLGALGGTWVYLQWHFCFPGWGTWQGALTPGKGSLPSAGYGGSLEVTSGPVDGQRRCPWCSEGTL